MEKPACCRVGDEEDEEEMELPGFRFHPTEEELVSFYLRKRVEGRFLASHLITDLDIYKCDPWDLPKMASRLGDGQREWYFFCPRDRKYRNSTRPNRVTVSGFWKATGTDRQVYSVSSSQCIGLKKSLVFYQGRASKGTKTDWMMHEFRLPSPPNCSHKDTCWAICKIFKRKASTSHCTMLNSQVSIIGERPCSGGKSLSTLHTHANHDSFGGDDFSEEDSKSQNSTPTSFNSPISISPSNHIQSSHTSPDKIAMGHLIKPSGTVEINTPSMQRKPLTLRISESSADDFLSPLLTPISKPSDNLGQSCTLGDGNTFFFDQSVQESMQLLTPDWLGHLVCSPQGNFTWPLWDQPGSLHDSSSFYAMSG